MVWDRAQSHLVSLARKFGLGPENAIVWLINLRTFRYGIVLQSLIQYGFYFKCWLFMLSHFKMAFFLNVKDPCAGD